MKKLIYRFLAAALALSTLMSCHDFLKEDPKGQFMSASYFNTVEDVQTALARMVYNSMDYYYEGKCLNMACRLADDICASNYKVLEVFKQSDGEQYVFTNWENCYESIKQANFILSLDGTVEGDEATLKQYMGMAYFYRGYAYYNLVRLYKQMPIITDVDPHPDIKSSTQQAVWDQVVSDMTKAEELLPASWGESVMRLEAPTVASAKAVLAETYLNMAGYPYNGGNAYYQMAADKAKEVINGNYGVGFDTYDNIWNNKTDQLTKEALLAYIYIDSSTEKNALINCFMPAEYSGWYWFMPEKGFFRNFPEGPRKDATFYTTVKTPGGDKAWDDPTRSVPLPVYRKMIQTPAMDYDKEPWNNDDWRYDGKVCALRFTQTACTYAEAIARATGSPDALAYDLMDNIRTRAGLPVYARGLSGDAFARLVVQERAWEMAGEFTRYSDLCRLQMVEEIHKQRGSDELVNSDYTGTPTKDTYYLPVPASEVLLNKNLLEIETGTDN
ncbi:MAG: RagB/SusD family nutrient uptake outer membrane protein [Bacteroidales bacterium]|nr:RagB/SusD family nutrient uptake outer membrane protein [Bacteroidales bacterium]